MRAIPPTADGPCRPVSLTTLDQFVEPPCPAFQGIAQAPEGRCPELVGLSVECQQGFTAALRASEGWGVPPNWSRKDWQRELFSVALGAASEALNDFDSLHGAPLAGFVFSRIKARALTRSRQEWRYAGRYVSIADGTASELPAPQEALSQIESRAEDVRTAMTGLSENSRWLLEQLFWNGRTEASLAAELKISQPAVSKRKKAAIRQMRECLEMTAR